jgi:hypothetical protein
LRPTLSGSFIGAALDGLPREMMIVVDEAAEGERAWRLS